MILFATSAALLFCVASLLKMQTVKRVQSDPVTLHAYAATTRIAMIAAATRQAMQDAFAHQRDEDSYAATEYFSLDERC